MKYGDDNTLRQAIWHDFKPWIKEKNVVIREHVYSDSKKGRSTFFDFRKFRAGKENGERQEYIKKSQYVKLGYFN